MVQPPVIGGDRGTWGQKLLDWIQDITGDSVSQSEMDALEATVSGNIDAIERVAPATAGDEHQTLGWTSAGVPTLLRIRDVDPTHPHFGAVGNDSNDDTEALQAAATYAAAAPVAHLSVPPGTFKITDKLTFPYTPGLTIGGAGQSLSTIKQYTNNTPILELITDPNTNHLRVHDMLLGWNSQQTTSHTSSRAIYLTGDANAEPFQLTFERLWMNKGYRGIEADTSAGNAVPWGVTMDSLTFTDFTGSVIRSMDAQGKPIWLLRNIFVDNPSATAAEDCIAVVAAEVQITGLDIEHWDTYHLALSGGTTPVLIDSYHMEWSNFVTAPYINSISNSGFIARNVSIGSITNTVGELWAFNGSGNTGSACVIEGMTLSGTPGGSTYPLRLDSGATGYVRGLFGASWTNTPVKRSHADSVSGMRQFNNQLFQTHGRHTASGEVNLATHPDELQLVNSTAGAVELDLDVCANMKGKTYTFKRDIGGNNVVIDFNNWGASQSCDGAATKTITTLYGWITVYCDGTTWHLINSGGTIT